MRMVHVKVKTEEKGEFYDFVALHRLPRLIVEGYVVEIVDKRFLVALEDLQGKSKQMQFDF